MINRIKFLLFSNTILEKSKLAALADNFTKYMLKGDFIMKTVHYNVSGLAGSQSKTKVKNALDKVEGVQMVAVDLSRGTIEIDYNEPANEIKIQQCIKNTGYDIIS